MSLTQPVLNMLACPDTHHSPLDHDAEARTLTCTQCGRVFEIRDGLPVLLLDEARPGTGPASDSGSGAGGGEA